MAENTKIEWADATWNPTTGCTKVSPGCKFCYAERMSKRLKAMGQNKYRNEFKLTLHPDSLEIPIHWKKPRMIFVNSMSDLFHKDVPFEFIDKVFAVMALCPQHTFQVLTKHPDRMAEYFSDDAQRVDSIAWAIRDRVPSPINYATALGKAVHEFYNCNHPSGSPLPLPNVWLGTSCEDQQRADERIPHLLRCPAVVRFLSCEPLLGTVKLTQPVLRGERYLDGYAVPGFAKIDHVIVGGESGPGARPCDLDWIRSIVGQCQDTGVPCFVKQLGSNAVTWNFLDGDDDESLNKPGRFKTKHSKGGDISEFPEGLQVREMPRVAALKTSIKGRSQT